MTYARVADICDEIARSAGLTPVQVTEDDPNVPPGAPQIIAAGSRIASFRVDLTARRLYWVPAAHGERL